MPKVTVDGIEIEVPKGATVLQACELAGKEIPRFCFHERLSIAGNCRMCLVEVAPGPPKPQASCALPAADGQAIRTDTAMVKKAREGVMEFLLINHPLDCPICDQGGECDLQDQAMAYGRSFSRFDENKRAIDDKYMGPVIKTSMTRCIQCTRCIRFAEEVAGVPEIGMLYRGEDAQITTYLEKTVTSELAGNLADVCPVGALLQKPQIFEMRSWELRRVPAIDVMDAVGSNIRLDVRQRQVMRILPRVHDEVNEEWIHDKTRHHVDALVRNRLDRPWVRDKGGKLREASWREALELFADKLKAAGPSVAAIAGDLLDAETMYAAKALLSGQGSALLEGRQTGLDYDVSNLAAVAFNSTIADIETRRRGAAGRQQPALGSAADQHPAAQGRAHGRQGFRDRARSRPGDAGRMARRRPQAARQAAQGGDRGVRQGRAAGGDRRAGRTGCGRPRCSAGAGRAAQSGSGRLERLQRHPHRRFAHGGADPRLRAKGRDRRHRGRRAEVVLLLGADEVDPARFAGSFKVYIGHHGDRGAASADLVLPGAAYSEKHGTYVNLEGRVQRGEKAVFPPGEAREDWTIFRAVSELARPAAAVRQFRPAACGDDRRASRAWHRRPDRAQMGAAEARRQGVGPGRYPIADFYLTNAICRASPTMHTCSDRGAARRAGGMEAAE